MSASADCCPMCGGSKHAGKTTFSVDLTFGVVVIREVPAIVCDQCGEAWLQDPIATRLEQVVSEARGRRRTIEVAHWNQVAA